MLPLPAELNAARNIDKDIQNIHRQISDVFHCWRKSLKSQTPLLSMLQGSLNQGSKAAALGATKI